MHTRELTLAAIASITIAASANANTCGTEPGPTANYTLPTGGTIQAQPIWSSGLGDNGVAVQNNQKGCGETAVYIYTGSNPSSDIWVGVRLYPTIVSPTVAQVKCAAPSLDATADVYYLGYPPGSWPYEFHASANNDQWTDGTAIYTAARAYNPYGITLQPYTVYTMSLICPPNGSG